MLKKISLLNLAYTIIVVCIILVLVFVISVIYHSFCTNDTQRIVKMLVPLGVILSALLASLSVLKSIQNTNILEEEKSNKQLIELNHLSRLYISRLISSFYAFFDNPGNKKENINNLESIYILIIKNEKLVTYLKKDLIEISLDIDDFIRTLKFFDEGIIDLKNNIKDKHNLIKKIDDDLNNVRVKIKDEEINLIKDLLKEKKNEIELSKEKILEAEKPRISLVLTFYIKVFKKIEELNKKYDLDLDEKIDNLNHEKIDLKRVLELIKKQTELELVKL